MIEIREYVDERGESPLAKWFDGLDRIAAARINFGEGAQDVVDVNPFRWIAVTLSLVLFIHHPLSDLFVVYNEQRFAADRFIRPGRSLIIKVTQMVAF